MPKLLGRPKVRRAILERHGIYYHEEVYGRKGTTPTISIPNHVDQLREALLDFSGIQIADSWKTVLSKEETDLRKAHRRQGINDSDCDLKPPESAYFDPEQLRLSDHYRNEKMEILEHDICISNSIAFDARKLDYDSENRWISFLKDQFFARYEDYVDHDYTKFAKFSLEENVLWEENLLWEESKRAFHWEGFTSDTRSYFPSKIGPNPDLSYGFKATHFNDQRGFEGMPYFNNFSFDVLGKLRAKTPAIRSTVTPGLSEWMLWQANHENETNETKNEPHKHRSRPGKNFDRYGMYKTYSPKDLPSSDFLCFPWAVVEAKHAQLEMSAEEYCQCQLANATACAYDLQETLIRSVNDSCPVDPIIGFTCIGPRVKLWLTYRGDDNKMHMVCVWAATVDSTWGALCLTKVINHMHHWAMRILRGKIVQYIDWASRTASTTSGTARKSGKRLGVPTVVSTARKSSTATPSNERTEGASLSGDLSRSKGTMPATSASSVPTKPIPNRNIRVKLPPSPGSISTAATNSSSSEILARAAQSASNTLTNQQALNGSSTPLPQDDGPKETSVTDGRTTPLNGFATASASTPASSQSSPIANSNTTTSPRSSVNTPDTSVSKTPLSSAPNIAGEPMMFRFGTAGVPRGLSPQSRGIIPIRPKFSSTHPEGSINPKTSVPFNTWIPPPPAQFDFNDLGTPLPRSKESAPPTTTPTCTTHQQKPVPASLVLPRKPSDTTTTPPTFVVPGSPPQRNTLSPSQQPLRSSRSESNLTAKAQSSASASQYTIFDRLALTPTTSTFASAPLQGTPSQPGSKDRLDVLQKFPHPLLETFNISIKVQVPVHSRD